MPRQGVSLATVVEGALEALEERRDDVKAPAPTRTLFDYWGPRGFVLDSPVAPGVDYYRLVNDDAEADAAMAAGEPPLHGHRGLSMQDLSHQQFLQYEGPNRLFNHTADGRTESMDDPPDDTFVPIWNSELNKFGGDASDRGRLIENFLRTAPEMLDAPAVLPQPIEALRKVSAASPGVDLAAAFGPRPPTADLTAPLRMAGGESIFKNNEEMQDRARARIPSLREGDIAVPEFYRPGQAYPMPRIIPRDSGPTTPPYMPGVWPENIGRPRAPSERTQSLIPLAQAWPALLGQAS